jgi:methionyl-tRNA formyltransferase
VPANGRAIDVVVLSCGDLGSEVASALRALARVRRVTLITAPYRRTALSTRGKIRQVYRTQGPWGLVRVLASKLASPFRRQPAPEQSAAASRPDDPAITHLHFANFHDQECIAALRALEPDLGVIAGTYILRESVFGVPKDGSINLHSGKVPKYRGAAPAFWELYNGESEVGITIHRVAAAVDAGDVLLQETFPLEVAPDEDPLAYLERYRREVLRPNGVRMVALAVDGLASGTLRGRPQDHSSAMTFKTPDYRAVRELRRRVRARRRRGRAR